MQPTRKLILSKAVEQRIRQVLKRRNLPSSDTSPETHAHMCLVAAIAVPLLVWAVHDPDGFVLGLVLVAAQLHF